MLALLFLYGFIISVVLGVVFLIVKLICWAIALPLLGIYFFVANRLDRRRKRFRERP